MAPLLNLPLEITHQILSELAGPSPEPGLDMFLSQDEPQLFDADRLNLGLSSMAKLCRTCHQLRESVEPQLNRFVYIQNADAKHLLSILRKWNARPHCAEYTRFLAIRAKQPRSSVALENIADPDLVLVSNLVKQLNLQLRSDWFEFSWRVDILIELVMFMARNVQWIDVSFTPKKGIYRGSFDWLRGVDGSPVSIRFNHLRHLKLFQSGSLTMDEIQPLIDRAPNLEYLYLDTVQFTSHKNRLPTSLTGLCLTGCSITPAIFESVTTDMDNLCHLRYDKTSLRQQSPMMRAFAKHGTTLKSLLVYFHLDSRLEVDLPLDSFKSLESLTTDLRSFGQGGGSQLMRLLPFSLRELRVVSFGGLQKHQLCYFADELSDREKRLSRHLSVYIDGAEGMFDYHRLRRDMTG
ncbi:Putative leucine-rich repeat domain superfamily [Colletotrichum destructivum]|uniref:Leucine-rich repeat domain superfamily n=1 Tax=Colletotrichum destructivum TaxID=34406 RepID=A0AAX4I090_9PEZI|nr:Putative leucine-rich repeat domain superfamily [Colletotrichum destructivum]